MTDMLDSPLPARFSFYIARLRQDGHGSHMLHYPGLTPQPEGAAKQIALEASAIDERAFHRGTEPIFPNRQLGHVLSVRSRSPLRIELCNVSSDSTTHRTAPRHGPTNMRLRCHPGIEVPPDCGIRVADESRSWAVEKCLVFDDSFPHEAWNDSIFTRTVLVVDVWHPDLTEDEVRLLQGL